MSYSSILVGGAYHFSTFIFSVVHTVLKAQVCSPCPNVNIGHPKSFREKVMFTWYTREVAIFSFSTRPRSGKAVIWREAPIACTLLFFRSLFALPISWSVLSFPMSGTSRKCIFIYVLGVPKRAILCCFSSTSYTYCRFIWVLQTHVWKSWACPGCLGLTMDHGSHPQLSSCSSMYM